MLYKLLVVSLFATLMTPVLSTVQSSRVAAVSASVIKISTCAELQDLDNTPSNRTAEVVLTSDIDCVGIVNFDPLGNVEDSWSGQPFSGTFDGRGHTISNLNISLASDNLGLFQSVKSATIKNLIIDTANVDAITENFVGVLVGEADQSVVDNVHARNISVSGDTGVGGLIGGINNQSDASGVTTITDTSTTGTVSGAAYSGGLIGLLRNNQGQSVTVQRSFSKADIELPPGSTSTGYGGLIGYLQNQLNADSSQTSTVTIEDSYASGDVEGYLDVGGLIGKTDNNNYASGAKAHTIIRRSYASGDVSAETVAGGFIGYTMYDEYEGELYTLESNFSSGSVTISGSTIYRGSFIGVYEFDAIATISSQNYADGSNGDPCTDGLVLSDCFLIDEAAQPNYFKNNSTNNPFGAWDFIDTWYIVADNYPDLRTDTDGDGVDQNWENGAPNNGDANNDGEQDANQPFVASVYNQDSGFYMNIETAPSCRIVRASFASESELSEPDSDYDYPLGLGDFVLDCLNVGDTTTVTLRFFGENDDYVLRKYNPLNETYGFINNATTSIVSIGGNSATEVIYSITDGGENDSDGLPNGTIVDPVGLAVSVSTEVIAENSDEPATLVDAGAKTILPIMSGLTIVMTVYAIDRRARDM